jgi:hypothetical protein
MSENDRREFVYGRTGEELHERNKGVFLVLSASIGLEVNGFKARVSIFGKAFCLKIEGNDKHGKAFLERGGSAR